MSVFVVQTYFVKPEKREKYMTLWRRWLKYMKENPEKVKEIRSVKLFTQTFGSISGAYVAVREFDSLADYERCHTRLLKDEEFMKLYQKVMLLIDPDTLSMNVWNSVM